MSTTFLNKSSKGCETSARGNHDDRNTGTLWQVKPTRSDIDGQAGHIAIAKTIGTSDIETSHSCAHKTVEMTTYKGAKKNDTSWFISKFLKQLSNMENRYNSSDLKSKKSKPDQDDKGRHEVRQYSLLNVKHYWWAIQGKIKMWNLIIRLQLWSLRLEISQKQSWCKWEKLSALVEFGPRHERNARFYTVCTPPTELWGHAEVRSDISLKDHWITTKLNEHTGLNSVEVEDYLYLDQLYVC